MFLFLIVMGMGEDAQDSTDRASFRCMEMNFLEAIS